jgi:hypothetical protein
MQLVFIHQQSGGAYFDSCLSLLRRFAEDLSGEVKPIFVIVDNSISGVTVSGGEHTISSDNIYREFSGWEAALNYVRRDLEIQDMNLILSNDTVLRHRAFDRACYRSFLTGFQLIFNDTEPALCGDIDSIPCSPPFYLNSAVAQYASTYLCALNNLALRKLESFIPQEDVFTYLESGINEISVLRAETCLSKSLYGNYLEGQLYVKNKQNIYPWYGFEKLTKINYIKLQLKLMSIVIEHSISQKLFERGVKFIDVKKLIRRSIWEKLIFRVLKINYSISWRLAKYLKLLRLN